MRAVIVDSHLAGAANVERFAHETRRRRDPRNLLKIGVGAVAEFNVEALIVELERLGVRLAALRLVDGSLKA
jgi:hypothetical protein